METQAITLESAVPFATAGSAKSRFLAVILLLGIACSFWVGSRYPALYKKYNQGTAVKVTGAITFGLSMPWTAACRCSNEFGARR